MQRLSGTATDLGGDATFLSASRLGTPNAFSTAIKQQPMSAITSSPTWMSLTEDPSGFINGTRNSLGEGVVGPQLLENEDRTTNKGSEHEFQMQEDTTLGILDLDNLPDLSDSKFLTSPYKPISSGDHTYSQTPAKYSAMSGFALQYSTSQSTGDFDKITAGVTDEQYILSQEGIHLNLVPSCNITSVGTTNDTTLLLSDVSSLTITPFPTKLREQLNITGLTCIPTPSIAHVTHMFNMTEVDDTFYDVSSMMNENEEDSKMKEKLTEEDWSKENSLRKIRRKKSSLRKKETLSETHFLTHKSAIYQSHEDSVSKQIPSTKSFHVADIVPSCTLKKSPKEDFDSDITSHTSTFSPHKLASFSVLDNPSQHSSLISHSSLARDLLPELSDGLVDTLSSLPPQHQSPPSPNEFISKYPYSNTWSSTVSQSPPIRCNKIYMNTINFPETKVGEQTMIEIRLINKDTCIYQLLVTFHPHDVGLHSQICDLEVSGEGLGVLKFRVPVEGKAISNIKSKSEIPHVITSHTNTVSRLPWEPSSKTITIYCYISTVNFPETKVREQTIIEIRLINKDTCTHQFQVIQPQSPFFVVHHEFELTPRHSARLPIYFKPTKESQSFEGILAVVTTTRHQMFAILRGNSL